MAKKKTKAVSSNEEVKTSTKSEKVEKISIYKDLLQRRVPQILGGYFIASFTVVQFMDWLVGRYPMSPYLPDFSLAILAGMIPTVLMLAYFHGKPGRDRWTKVEKLGIPINLVIAITVMILIFNGKELGATTTKLTVVDETGQTMERVIPTSGFRKSIATFFFENESGDSSEDWLQYGFPQMLTFDLYQDLFLDLYAPYLSYIKMKDAGFPTGIGLPLTLQTKIADDLNKKYFITGSFNKQGEKYVINSKIYETKRGKLVSENMVENSNIFELIDELSLVIRKELEIPDGHIDDLKDLPVSEILTSSMSAFRQFILGENSAVLEQNYEASLGFMEESVKEDPSFALAYSELQALYMLTNQSEKANQAATSLMQHIYRLPERIQLQLKYMYYFNTKQDAEKGFSVLKLWADLYPDDIDVHTLLAAVYEQRGDVENSISEYKRILELDPEKYEVFQKIAILLKNDGQFDEALNYFNLYAKHFPNKYESFSEIGDLYLTYGDYEKARTNLEKASIIAPDNISVLKSLADIERKLGNLEKSQALYHDAISISKTASDSAEVYETLMSYYYFRGQTNKVIEYTELAQVIYDRIYPPAFKLIKELGFLSNYIHAGKTDLAFQKIEAIKEQTEPPFDLFVPLGYMDIYTELGDADKADEAIEGVDLLITTFQFEMLRPEVLHFQGRVLELRQEYKRAISIYDQELELRPTELSINRQIGRCYRELKELKKAEEFMQKDLAVDPFNPKSNYEMALIYYAMGQKPKAIEYMNKALLVWEEADPEFKPAALARQKLEDW